MPEKTPYLRSLLLQRSAWFEERTLERARAHGYERVTPAMSRMFGHMSGRPIGLSDLARRLGITRQAVHKCASDAAQLGLIEFAPDPANARVVRVQFTSAGWAMSAQASRDFDDLEAALRQRMGAQNLEELKRLLQMAWTEQEATQATGQPATAQPDHAAPPAAGG